MTAGAAAIRQPAFLEWAGRGFTAELVRVRAWNDQAVEERYRGKRPAEEAWQSLAVTPELVSEWARVNGANVGVRTRAFPAVDIDVDDPGIADACASLVVKELGSTFVRGRSNSPRRVLLYRLAGEPFKKTAVEFTYPGGKLNPDGKPPKVEFLATGRQVVVAGRHHTGADIEWSPRPPAADELPEFTGVQRDALAAKLRALLVELGCTVKGAAPAARKVVAHMSHQLSDADEDRDLAARALDEISPDAVYEEWVKVGMALHSKWPEAGGTGFNLWDEWSSGGTDYPGTAELDSKWRGFKPGGGITFGTLLHMSGVSRPVSQRVRLAPEPDGSEPETDVGEAPVIDLSGAEVEQPRAAPKPGGAEIVLSVSEIFAPLPPVSWVCQALDMAPGAPALVAGYGYSGKTVAVQDFALATASGSLAWGRFPVREGRVLHLDFEQGSYLTRLRYQRLADARGLDPRSIEGRLAVRPFPPWYLDAETDDFLAGLVDGFDLVIVDSFRAACPGTEENSSEARVPLDRLTRLSERTGALAVVLHHARKPSQDPRKQGGGARMAIRGSGALYDACGSVLVFASEKGEPVTVEHEKARITGRTHDPFQLWIEDVATDAGPEAGLRVSVLDSAPPTKQTPSERIQEVQARVMEFVREQGGTTGGINVACQYLGGKRETLSAAISELVRAGRLERSGTTREPTLSIPGTT